MSDFLVESVLRGVLGGRKRKKSRNALRYLTGHRGAGSIFMNPTTIMTAAGLAWGIFETLQQPGGAAAGPAGAPAAPGGGLTSANLPPLPNVGVTTDDATRLFQLAVSAATADGAMNEHEREAIAQHAGPDAADAVTRELALRRPLAQIVGGVSDQTQRATLYVLAFTVVRADEQVSGAERIYLAQLANLLGLDPGTVQKLEADTAQRIDTAHGES